MNGSIAIIPKLQFDAADSSKSVGDMLRLAKIAASKLGTAEALVWINRELDGYPNTFVKDLPEYRRLHGTAEAWNPYRGWEAILFADAKTESVLSFCPVGQSLPSLEAMLKSGNSSGNFTFGYPTELAEKVRKSIGRTTDVHIKLGYGQIHDIVDQVRNLILNWTLALEQGGVLGEAMTFTAEEKTEAAPITQQYFIQNVGVLGNVDGGASVRNVQFATALLDLAQARKFIDELKGATSALPGSIQSDVVSETAKAEAALESDPVDDGKLRAALAAIGAVCEGAAGNLTAAGIIVAIRMILGV